MVMFGDAATRRAIILVDSSIMVKRASKMHSPGLEGGFGGGDLIGVEVTDLVQVDFLRRNASFGVSVGRGGAEGGLI